jgi:hypothetical protein
MRTLAPLGLSVAALLAFTFATSPSEAEPFYSAGKVSVAVERVFGIHYSVDDVDPPGPIDDKTTGAVVGFGWYATPDPLHIARAAVDGFVIDHLSLGGSLAFFTQTGDFNADGVLFSPRVGWAIPLSRVFTFWPRGGFSFLKVNNGTLFGLTAEAMFVASPNPSWGLLFGPTLDFDFIGDRGTNVGWSHFAIGFPTVGLMATF